MSLLTIETTKYIICPNPPDQPPSHHILSSSLVQSLKSLSNCRRQLLSCSRCLMLFFIFSCSSAFRYSWIISWQRGTNHVFFLNHCAKCGLSWFSTTIASNSLIRASWKPILYCILSLLSLSSLKPTIVIGCRHVRWFGWPHGHVNYYAKMLCTF